MHAHKPVSIYSVHVWHIHIPVYTYCFLRNRTIGSTSDFTTRELGAFMYVARPRLLATTANAGECNIQQCRRRSLLLDFSVSSPICSLFTLSGHLFLYSSRRFYLSFSYLTRACVFRRLSISFSESSFLPTYCALPPPLSCGTAFRVPHIPRTVTETVVTRRGLFYCLRRSRECMRTANLQLLQIAAAARKRISRS